MFDYIFMYQSTILANKTQFHSDFLQDNIWNLLDMTYKIPDSYDFDIVKVDQEKYIGRPDLISLDAYGDPMFADIICKVNGISNPFELNVGMILIIPSINSVTSFIQTSPIDERESTQNNPTPSPKKKNEKRQANEAIVGDKRFKIDPAKGIVIY